MQDCIPSADFTAGAQGLILLETSAKNAHNVEQAFTKMANEIKSKVQRVRDR